jgi:hypothetical protein
MKKQLVGIAGAIGALTVPAIAFAQQAQYSQGLIDRFRTLLAPVVPNSNGINFLTVVVNVLQFLTLLAGIIAIFYLIWAGIQYITAGGDDDKAKKARAGIFNAVIGIVVIIFAYAIIVYVSSIAGTANGFLQGGAGGVNNAGNIPFDPNAPLVIPQT